MEEIKQLRWYDFECPECGFIHTQQCPFGETPKADIVCPNDGTELKVSFKDKIIKIPRHMRA